MIDYKTGAQSLAGIFGTPPASAQLPFYLTGRNNNHSGLAWAEIHAKNVGLKGLSLHEKDQENRSLSLKQMKRYNIQSLDELKSQWQTSLSQAAKELKQGYAAVEPRHKPLCCQQCDLKPLCRVEINDER